MLVFDAIKINRVKKPTSSLFDLLDQGMFNLLLVAGQIFVCKFITGRIGCSNQRDVLRGICLKISVPKTGVL